MKSRKLPPFQTMAKKDGAIPIHLRINMTRGSLYSFVAFHPQIVTLTVLLSSPLSFSGLFPLSVS